MRVREPRSFFRLIYTRPGVSMSVFHHAVVQWYRDRTATVNRHTDPHTPFRRATPAITMRSVSSYSHRHQSSIPAVNRVPATRDYGISHAPLHTGGAAFRVVKAGVRCGAGAVRCDSAKSHTPCGKKAWAAAYIPQLWHTGHTPA